MDSDFNLNYEILTVKNVDTQPFEVVYNKRSYGILQPGQVQQMPGFLARHAAKHIIDQILNRLNIRTNNDVERDKWEKQVVIHTQTVQASPVKSKDQELADEVARLNTPLPVNTVDAVLSQFKSSEPSVEMPVVEDNAPTVLPAPVAVAEPTREQLISYAQSKLGMTMDEKTLEAFNAMSDKQLAVELNYEA